MDTVDNSIMRLYRKTNLNKEQGFTLIELLVVIIIIGVLAAIALPIFMNQKNAAADAAVKNDLRNSAVSLQEYLTTYKKYPITFNQFSDLRVNISNQDFYSIKNNFLICVDNVSGKYGIFAESVSGNSFMFSSEGGLKPLPQSWSTTRFTLCPIVGIEPTGDTADGRWGFTNGNWGNWVNNN